VEELRNRTAKSLLPQYSQLDHLKFVVELVEPRAEKGILQEEAVLGALHDRIVNQTDWYRESSAVAILLGLAITFWRLAQALPKDKTITAEALSPVLSLVGATWPLVGAGLILYGLSTVWQKLVWEHYDAWRHWLETVAFPELGASRSTLKKLDATLEEFTKVAREITTLLMPIQDLSPVLATFQGDLITRLVPAIKDGLSRVSVGLSDQALNELRLAGTDSLRAVREIQDNQARILSISVAAERNVVEIAASVSAVAQNAQAVASALEKHQPALQANSAAVARLHSELEQSIGVITASSRDVINAVTANRDAVDSSRTTTTELIADLRGLRPELSANGAALRVLSTAMAQVQSSMEATEQLFASIPAPLRATAECLPALVQNLDAVQSRWSDAILQIAAITDEIGRRTNTLDEHAGRLADALTENNGHLQTTAIGLSDARGDFELLRKDLGSLAAGKQEIVTAFRDLQTLAQKLKHLGNTITGHFNIWQHQTKEVFQTAQTTSKSVHESMIGVVKAAGTASHSIESSLEQAAKSISQLESQIHNLTARFEPQAYKMSVSDAGGNGHLEATAVIESLVVGDADSGAV
jgi:chromosome segregation ATPase